jgi:GNAT superfamily N-acetyltransferase
MSGDYLEPYRDSPGAMVVGAFDGGAAGGRGDRHADGGPRRRLRRRLAGTGLDLSEIFYCAESVLLPEYRGQGIGHRFFDLREAHARALGAACRLLRRRSGRGPSGAARRLPPLDAFWRKRGYAPLPARSRFSLEGSGRDRRDPKAAAILDTKAAMNDTVTIAAAAYPLDWFETSPPTRPS